ATSSCAMSSASGSLSFWPVHPGDGFCNPARVGRALARGPERKRLVAIAKHTAMARLVFGLFMVRVHEAEAAAQQLNIIGLTSQKKPTRTHMKLFRVGFERPGRVLLRLDSDRVEEDVAPKAVAEKLLHLHQIRRDVRADPLALRVHKTDDHNLVADQVVEEAHPFAFVRREDDVGEITRADGLARGRERRSVLACPPFPRQCQYRKRRPAQSGQHFFPSGVRPRRRALLAEIKTAVALAKEPWGPLEDLELLEVNVHRVGPRGTAEAEILQGPLLHGILRDREPDRVAIHELTVDLPLAVSRQVKAELALDEGLNVRTRQREELWRGGRVHAVVRHLRPVHDDLEQEVALARGQNVAGRPAPVDLLQTVLQVNRLA